MQLFFRLFIFVFFSLSIVVKAQEQLAHKGKILTPEECIEISAQKEQAGDKKEASRFLNQAATIHWERKEYNKAVELFEKSLKLNESIANLQGMIGIYSNLGMIYADQAQYSQSLNYFDKAVAGRRQGKDKVALASNLINTAVVLNNLKQHEKAAVYLEEALA
ncbi:MAG: tetratricopeptide repeat protein, partial [Thermoflexibacteraceae bacterium]